MSKPTLTTLPSSASVEDVVAVIERDGGVIIEQMLGADTLESLKSDIDASLAAIPYGTESYFAGTQTRRAGRLFARSKHMADIALHPLYHGSAQRILQKPVDVWFGQDRTSITPGIQVGVTQAIEIHPGQGTQPLHRDDTSFLWRHPAYGREGRLQIMVALSPFTEENGGTRVIPGSHQWDDERMPLNEEAIATEMSPGSALLWIGSTYHGGGENKSTSARTGITMSFDLANLRQEENQYLSIPLNTIREYPEEIQRLLGWDSGDNFMGWVEQDGQMIDPHKLLEAQDAPDTVGIAAQ